MLDCKKIVLMIENKRLYQALASIIKKKGYEIVTKYPALSDINLIKINIRNDKSTQFIRDAYNQLLKENEKPPLIIVLDYRIDLGLDRSIDPDKKKILRTLLISNVIYTRSKSFSNNRINFIFVGGPNDIKELEIFKDYPHFIFKTVKTTNETINTILDFYINNPDKTKSAFKFDYLLIDETNDITIPATKFENIIKEMENEKRTIENKEKTKNQTPIMDGEFEPAKIIYKISDIRLYADGEIYNIENNPKFGKYKCNIIYVVGYFVNKTIPAVNAKIEKFISEELPKIRKITPEDKIVVSLNSHSVIDGATTHALNTLISFKLHHYKNISILTDEKNYKKMENSPGFISIRKFIKRY